MSAVVRATVVLPGGMGAKEAAEANLIARREETAAMPSQADTTELLADNAMLMRLSAAAGCPPLVAYDATREAGKDRGQGGSSRGVCDVSTGRGGRSQQAVLADSRSDSSLANDGSDYEPG